MSKISGYANSVSALGTDDLIDVSEKISSSPDVYESRKMTGATLATFISSYAANIISTNGLTMTANRTHDLGSYVLTFQNAGLAIEGAQTIKAASAVADMFNLYDSTSGLLSRFNSTFISFWSTTQIASEVFGVTGHTILKGVDTAGTSKALDIYNNDTVPTSLWSFRNNGDVYLGKTTVFDSGSERVEFKSSTFNQFSIYRAVNGGGSGAAIQFNLNNSIGTKTNYAEIVALINDNTNGSEDGAIWLRNMIGGTVRTVAEIDETEFYINGSSFTTNKFRVNDNLTINKATGYTRLKGDSGLASPYPLQLYRNISGAGYGVGFEQIATNSSSSEYTYAQTVMTIEDSTAGSEDSQQRFYISSGGSLVQKMTVKSNTINFANLPTSATGLSTGDIWNDSGTLKIV